MQIAIISSSTRTGRLSPRVAFALQNTLLKRNLEVVLIDLSVLQLPVFEERFGHRDDPNGTLEETNKVLTNSDAFIFLSPEYNGGICSSLKNFIDVFAKAPFEGKPIGVATASTGALGGIRAAYQLQQQILSIFAYPIPQMLTVGKMDQVIHESGEVISEETNQKINKFLNSFIEFSNKF